MHSISDKAVIVGIGHTAYSQKSGRSELAMAAEACLGAIQDAGLQPDDIDGITRLDMDTVTYVALQNALGIPYLRYYPTFGYANLCAAVTNAAMAVATGMASNVLVFRSMNGRSGGKRLGMARE